jgi:hypothetical protein
MKKAFVTLAALTMAAGISGTAHAMECCEDGKCECCKKEDDGAAPAPDGADHH